VSLWLSLVRLMRIFGGFGEIGGMAKIGEDWLLN
jgi:hypothetical protein